ncbi:hypothetical protein [Microbacterium ulmi]|uniref:Uncharacterized protein n=1 Tax=Microbacterium ulmi TaxID=179095 RepID=A0A7Y2M1S1_9MICO|nr:hypothetical protein [Microbacterium ulmi]NII69504.1 hypothetical protein [Microbacterium ulmi]NNH04895.1 hypothetical protein [Microbacterium ulmi]
MSAPAVIPHAEDPVVTMRPDDVRALGSAHRAGFDVETMPDVVQLDKPYPGGQEIIDSGAVFDALRDRADAARIRLGALPAEFLREFLLRPVATAVLHEACADRPPLGEDHTDAIARACRTSWDLPCHA